MSIHYKNIVKGFLYFLVPGILLSPFIIGGIESTTNVELLGGRCRLDNTQAVMSSADRSMRLVSGVVIFGGEKINHLWGVRKDGKIIDVTCTTPVKRRAISVLNPWSGTVPFDVNNSTTILEYLKEWWNRAYLVAYLSTRSDR